ncbi:MAG: nucleotidyltransferase domain-containing protein [Bdellovibrionota bacterium]
MTDQQKYGLNPSTISSLKSIFAKHKGIEKVLIYGSRAKGNFRNGSDIDLTLVGPTLGVSDLLKIENEIEELLLPYKVDLSIFGLIEDPDVVEHIERVGKEFS